MNIVRILFVAIIIRERSPKINFMENIRESECADGKAFAGGEEPEAKIFLLRNGKQRRTVK